MLTDRIIISPELRDSRVCADWLFSQGDMRGFICNIGEGMSEYLVVFDSYGATHNSVATAFHFGKRPQVEAVAIIFRVDGSVWIDMGLRTHSFDDVGNEYTRKFIRSMYRTRGIEPRWTNDE